MQYVERENNAKKVNRSVFEITGRKNFILESKKRSRREKNNAKMKDENNPYVAPSNPKAE